MTMDVSLQAPPPRRSPISSNSRPASSRAPELHQSVDAVEGRGLEPDTLKLFALGKTVKRHVGGFLQTTGRGENVDQIVIRAIQFHRIVGFLGYGDGLPVQHDAFVEPTRRYLADPQYVVRVRFTRTIADSVAHFHPRSATACASP